MKKTTCTTFKSILDAIYLENINSKLELEANKKLYADFWIATKDFVHYATLSKTSKSSDGTILAGNSYKINRLVELGVTTKEDLESDSMIKIIDKLDFIFAQPINKQYNYCYTIINNFVNDCFRKISNVHYNMVSIDEPIRSVTVSEEDRCKVADLIPDNTYNAEDILIANETIKELKESNSNQILHEIAVLSTHPDELMVRLACKHCSMKPRTIASMITKGGVVEAFYTIIDSIADDETNNLTQLDLLDAIAGNIVTGDSIMAETNDHSVISKQVSRLVYRADKHLSR